MRYVIERLFRNTSCKLGCCVDIWCGCEKKLKRKGYKFVKENKSFAEKLSSFISIAFKGSIPVYNVINTIVILCMGDKLYDYMEKKLLEKGKIYMPKDEPENSESEMESSSSEIENNNTNSVQKVNSEKKYEDMTLEEKMAYLEEKKELILKQNTKLMDTNSFDNLGQQESVLKKRSVNNVLKRKF